MDYCEKQQKTLTLQPIFKDNKDDKTTRMTKRQNNITTKNDKTTKQLK